ncbi:MAG: rhombosortase [Burkholderiaceae bacterium]|nr:rhombosortase [Burkholderiaceae bacterium]
MARGVRLIAGRAWTGLALAAGLVTLALWLLAPQARGDLAEALVWRPERAWDQPWRWFSAALLHLSPLHLAANLAGLGLVAALGRAAGCGPRATLAWALAWPLTQGALLLQPALLRYAGLSGVLHAAVAVAVVQLLRGGAAAPRLIGAGLGLGLAAKLLLETPWAGPLRQVPGWDIAIAPAAHAAGAVAGLLCALALGVGRVSR